MVHESPFGRPPRVHNRRRLAGKRGVGRLLAGVDCRWSREGIVSRRAATAPARSLTPARLASSHMGVLPRNQGRASELNWGVDDETPQSAMGRRHTGAPVARPKRERHSRTGDHRPAPRPNPRGGGLELAELEPKHRLVKSDLTGSLEAVVLVEGDRTALSLACARVQHLDSGSATEVLDDQVERGSAESSSLVTLVDE